MLYAPMPTDSGVGRCLGRSLLGHHVVADHPPGLADVDLVRPVAVVGELVLRPGPSALISSRTFSGTPRVVGEELHQPLLVGHVLLDDLAAAVVVASG